jgi:2-pyrone-4,6-dicarboxylate lactonase
LAKIVTLEGTANLTRPCPCPAPLPPRAPRRKAPPGACDSHIHVFGPFGRFPLNDNRSYTPPECPVDQYQQVMAALGLDRVVIVQGSAHGFRLEAAIDAISRLGKRARGIAVTPVDVTDEALDRLHEAGFRGLRVVTNVKGGIGPEQAGNLARRIARLGWHLQFLLNGPDEMEEIAPLLVSLPVPYVIDSMARFRPEDGPDHPGFRSLLRLLETGNCWVKLNGIERRSHLGPPYADMTPIADALIAVRPDRLVWGTDWPHPMAWDHAMPDDADLLDWTQQWDTDDAIRNAILVDNPVRLYGFEPL